MENKLLTQLYSDYKKIDKMMRDKAVFIEPITGKSYFTGYEYKTLYDWDQYFEAIVQLYMGWDTTLIKNGVTIFLDMQEDDGFIPRSVPRCEGGQGDEHVKPFLAQIALLIYKQEKDLSWIGTMYYEKLKNYLLYWLDTKDKDKNNLSIWDSAPHTGMDNQHERAGWWYDCFSEGVDLNSYMVRECRAMTEISKIKGKTDDAKYFEERADVIAMAVQTLWNEEDGIFYDRNEKTGETLKVKYVGVFATLWAKIATPEQAERMVTNYISNPKEFWRPFPLSVYAASEPGYSEEYLPGDLGCSWRANTWISTNYYVFQGLRYYGYNELADKLANKTYEMVKQIGDREYYTSESCTGCGLDPFWGWSLLAYFMPLEAITGNDPTELNVSDKDLMIHRVL